MFFGLSCQILLESWFLMAGWRIFLRGEGKFPAMPCRLFYGAGEKCVMRVVCKINFMGCGDAHLFLGGCFQFSVFS